MTKRDWLSPTGASNTTMPSFMATIRLLPEPPTIWFTSGASSTILRLPPTGTNTASLSRKRPSARRRSTH